MNSIQYEELCRFALADLLEIEPSSILSITVPNPSTPNLPDYKHQIDLYWETEDAVSRYLNIANAKWRSSDKIDQPDVLLLQQVRQKVAAHKALIITNTGFTAGADAAARDCGIGLHLVSPNFDVSLLALKSPASIQASLSSIDASSESRIYSHRISVKALQPGRPSTSSPVQHSPLSGTKIIRGGPSVQRHSPSGTKIMGPKGSTSRGGTKSK